MHYLFLTTFLWMGVEAAGLYRAVVLVFTTSSNAVFLITSCLIAWGKHSIWNTLRALNLIEVEIIVKIVEPSFSQYRGLEMLALGDDRQLGLADVKKIILEEKLIHVVLTLLFF